MVTQVHCFRFRDLSTVSKLIYFSPNIIVVSEAERMGREERAERMGWEEGAERRSVEPHGDIVKQMQNSRYKYIQWKD